MKEKDVRDVLNMRIILETESMKEAFENIVAYHLEEIKAQIEKASKKEDTSQEGLDVWGVWEDNEEFHTLLASYSDNQILLRFLKTCMGIQKRFYAQNQWNTSKTVRDRIDLVPHQGIYQALEEKNLEKTLELLKKDLMFIE